MRIGQWAQRLAEVETFRTLAFSSSQRQEWSSLTPEARPVLLAPQLLKLSTKSILVTSNHDRALAWQAKLTLCGVPESQIRQLPSGMAALFEDSAPERTAISDRIGALRFLVQPGPGLLIATAQAALERTLPLEVLQEHTLTFAQGTTLDLVETMARLEALGYEKTEPVRAPGQWSNRGGILDVWPMGQPGPIRLDLFGDEIESLRSFDPSTQRSLSAVANFDLCPSRETLFDFDARGWAHLEEMVRRTVEIESQELSEAAAQLLQDLVDGDLRAIEKRVFFDRLDLYRPLLHPDSGCALDLIPDGGWAFLDEPVELEVIAQRSEEELSQVLASRAARGEILKSTAGDFMLGPEHFSAPERVVAMTLMGLPSSLTVESTFDAGASSLESYRGQPQVLARTLANYREAGFHIAFATDQPHRAKAVLEQVEIYPSEPSADDYPALEPGILLTQGNLAGGFVIPAAKVALVTDQELFGVGRLKLPQKRFNEGAPIATVLDLKPGDYVVHISYGIGIFQGLVKRTVAGVEKEYLFIQYEQPDKLYVPADQLDRIQKYLNPGDVNPKLNRLRGGDWQRTVGKARDEAREFARDLIKLYALRKKTSRPSYGPDSPWQSEMESTFPWVETPAQYQAILDAKADLRESFPMDRLICGDVGFGKTEVAIRAAFKVVQSGRQVAILCPTTILSEQHFRNFAERLAAFPIRLELLNRFRSAAEKRQVLAGLKDGSIDLVIGTHALLGQEIEFKDLGLVVIDEEQKFGVKQKEVLKNLRVNVDVLSMSATPIPRTLSMALMDIRQMSLINDPPPGRLPIRTYVRPYSAEVVREAVLRELARGGQVYYVYNRVEGIFHVAEKLRKLLPMAKIGVGHGQMSEKELEPIMIGFIKGELDVLLSTTIIENGLDIPNANTMIVENADRLGLSQLYQLRGRVGRSDRQAYAYLLYQTNKELTENAMARLQSLQEFSSLGSGYSLAFRDLQIRGAGELLGAKQSGTMATVGYELFTQIINEEVTFLKAHADGESPEYKDPLEGLAPLPTADLPVAAFIPEPYVSDQAQRLYTYKRMMSSRSRSELDEVREEVLDRYGKFPAEVTRAFRVMEIRLQARDLGVAKLDGTGGRIAATFAQPHEISPRVWTILSRQNREAYLSRGDYIWPYSGDPLAACDSMLAAFHSAVQAVEDQRAALEL